MPLDTLRLLDAGTRFGPDFSGETIPTLEEVLDAVGHRIRLNIEIKSRTRGLVGVVTDVVRMVRDRSLHDQVIVSSFDPQVLSHLRRVGPEFARALLYDEHGPLVKAPLWGRCLSRPQALHPHWRLVDEKMVQWAHRRGYLVNVWTVDDVQMARQLANWGVDGIITNSPRALLQAFSAADVRPEDNVGTSESV